MTFREFFRYELSYRLRQPSTWMYFGVVWIGTLVAVHLTSTENARVVNAPGRHAELVALLNFLAMVITAGIFGDAATRDPATRMQSLFSTAPIRTFDYLGGRFLASFVVNAVLLAGMPLLVALCYALPWLAHFNWAPFQVATFVQPYLLLTLPNLFIGASIAYTIAALTKNALATYLGMVVLAVLYVIVVNQGLGNDTVENLVDPFALGSLQKVKSYWTPSEHATRLVGFPSSMVLNRAVWITVAAALLVFLQAKYSFTHPGLRGRKRIQATGGEDEPVRHAIASAPMARREFGGRGRLAQVIEVARHSFRDITRNRLFLAVIILSIPWVWAIGWQVGAIVFDTDTWPVTHLVAGSLNAIAVMILMTVFIALVAGELTWREREVGAGEIAAAAPVRDWIPLAGRFIALVGVIVLLQAVYTVSGIALQAAQGYYHFELGLWIQMMFGIQLVDHVIYAALAMALHVVVNQKHMGHLLAIGAFVISFAGANFIPALGHNLLSYNGDPGVIYSDMSRFGPFLRPWAWFKVYWAAWALLLGVIATVFWVRSSEGGFRARLRLGRLRMAGPAAGAALAAGALILATGGFVFYNTNIRHEYLSVDESRQRAVAYETPYRRFADAPSPTVVSNVMRVELFPERGAAMLTGRYALQNATGQPIDSVHIAMNDDVDLRALTFGGGARLVLDDSVLRHRIYDLTTPLQPGDTTSMTWEVRFEPRGFGNGRPRTDVVSNGTYIDRRWEPQFGYQPGRELQNERVRPTYGLAPRPPLPGPSDTGALVRSRMDEDGTSYVHADVTIGTALDQIAVTPGKLVREWTENGRRYFHYVTPTPVSHGDPVLSARYAVREDRWRDVPLKVYYHPTHTFNLDRIVAAMKSSLEYNSAAFGPYMFHELRVVEFPRYASFARAHPHTIAFGEGSAFITRIDADARVDRPFFVIAHEIGHQWWGSALRGARLRGGAILSETLASYSAIMAMEKTYGPKMAWRFVDYEMGRYLGGRRNGDVPMIDVTTERHLYYSKGAIVMYTLRDMLGEEPLTRALRAFYQKHADQKPPFPTSLDLVAELRAVTPDSLQYLITDLLETITLYDVKTDAVAVDSLPDGNWRVTVTVTARKFRADSLGKETQVPMNDLVEIGAFAGQGDRWDMEPLYVRRYRLRSGTQTIAFTVPKRPNRAGADPQLKLIQRIQHPLPRFSER